MGEPVEIKKPLTAWEKIKAGVKGFAKATLQYLPKGLLISGALLGGITLMGGPIASFMNLSPETFLPRLGFTMLLGGLISGGIGAWQGVASETGQRNAEIDAQGEELERARAHVPLRQIEMDPVVPNVPLLAKKPPGKAPVFGLSG